MNTKPTVMKVGDKSINFELSVEIGFVGSWSLNSHRWYLLTHIDQEKNQTSSYC